MRVEATCGRKPADVYEPDRYGTVLLCVVVTSLVALLACCVQGDSTRERVHHVQDDRRRRRIDMRPRRAVMSTRHGPGKGSCPEHPSPQVMNTHVKAWMAVKA